MGFSNLTVIIRNLLENGNALRISEDLEYSNKFCTCFLGFDDIHALKSSRESSKNKNPSQGIGAEAGEECSCPLGTLLQSTKKKKKEKKTYFPPLPSPHHEILNSSPKPVPISQETCSKISHFLPKFLG